MAKAKKGEVLSCGSCGMIVFVDAGGVGMAEIICCKKPMAKGKAAADKAKKKLLSAKASTKTVKAAPKKAKTKTAPKKKPAVKRPAAAKAAVKKAARTKK
jgi:hypothetical protein